MNALKRARILADMTQDQLAQASGVSRGAITNLERGASRGNGESWQKLAAALGMSVGELMEDEPPAEPETPTGVRARERALSREEMAAMPARQGAPALAEVPRRPVSRLERRMVDHAWDADRLREAIELPGDDAFPVHRAWQFVGAYGELREEYEEMERTGEVPEEIRVAWARLDAAYGRLRPALDRWKDSAGAEPNDRGGSAEGAESA